MVIRYFAAGGMRVDYHITANQHAQLRQMGGNAIYSAVGTRIWTADVGILSRVGDNYPGGWLDRLEEAGICTMGVVRVPGYHEMRTFCAYLNPENRVDTEPARHFARAWTATARRPSRLCGLYSRPGTGEVRSSMSEPLGGAGASRPTQ